MNVSIYPGSSSFFPGNTPFGFYDNDYQFQTDADKVTTFCARRLGYPIMEVELQDLNFYTAFEEAVTTYGNELYAYQVRDNFLSIEGTPNTTDLNQSLITPTLATLIKLSQQYAVEAGTGGNVNYYSGSVTTIANIQDYNLTDWAISESIVGEIEIKRIFWQPPPAVNQVYNLSVFSGLGGVPAVGSYGLFGSTGFLMYPTSLLMQSAQAVEMQNQISLGDYTFELINNQLRIFPIPSQDGGKIWFQYLKINDRLNSVVHEATSSITNVSNAGYNNPTYSTINSVGRQWIFEYTLALCKEMLGYVRGKYSTVPIPGAEVTLNQNELVTAGKEEKTALITSLRLYFDETSRKSLLERRQAESTARQFEISQVPMTIFIG